MKYNKQKMIVAVGIFALGLTISSCGNEADSPITEPTSTIEANSKKNNNASVINIDGALFSISSPLESIVILKKSSIEYNKDVMLKKPDLSSLTSNFDKAITLGMMGADLGYSSIHEDQMKSMEQFKSLSSLSESLNLSNAIDQSLIKRLANNTSNVDSMMTLVSEFYRQADQYLQDNDRMDVASWILAGGWIESMYFSLDVIKDGNEVLKERIAGQRNSYKNLLRLVERYSTNEKSKDLVKDLRALEGVFEKVVYTYNYKQPQVDIDKKLTVLKGETKYQFTDETLLNLSNSIKALRAKIING